MTNFKISSILVTLIFSAWLNHAIYDNEILPTSFTINQNDRSSRGGVVMITINKSICSELISCISDLEVLSIRIKAKSTSLNICVVYMPPNSNFASYEALSTTYLTELSTDNSPIIIAGDFNLPDINWAHFQQHHKLQICFVI